MLTIYKEPLPNLPIKTCDFAFTPRADQPNFQGRLAVVYQNNVLQMLFLEGKVLSDPALADKNDQIHFQLAEVKGLGNLNHLQKFDLALYNETDSVQGAGLMFFGGQAGYRQPYGLKQGILDIITNLKDAGDPALGNVSLEARKDALVRLANQGSIIYENIQDQIGRGNKAMLHLREAQRLQLVSPEPDAFPLEMVYVYPAPTPEAELCPNAEQVLLNGKCATCERISEKDTAKVVCPLGFLGMRCIIERHIIQSDAMENKDIKLCVGWMEEGKKILPLKSSLFATSREVTADDLQQLSSSLRVIFPDKLEYAQNWSDWKEKIKLSPTILILIPHHVKSGEIPSLEIGKDILWSSGIKEPVVHVSPDIRPLVLLMGCQTAVPEAPYQGFAAAFSRAGAAITVVTLSPIHESHAVPITEILVRQFHQSALSKQSFGDALLQARRTAMAAGYAEVLTLMADGDVDWILTMEA